MLSVYFIVLGFNQFIIFFLFFFCWFDEILFGQRQIDEISVSLERLFGCSS